MGSLRLGQTIKPPSLTGMWAVWSAAADAPGAYFITPVDAEARAQGIKYAVIRATQARDKAKPDLELIRTDPHIPNLIPPKKSINRRNR